MWRIMQAERAFSVDQPQQTANRILAAFLICVACFASGCSSPTLPPITTVAIRSVKYVRVRPVVRTATVTPVIIGVTLPNRSGTIEFQPMQVDASTFIYNYPQFLAQVPIDTEITLFVIDDAVAPEPPPTFVQLARDLYVNDTHIAVRGSEPNEIGFFRVTAAGVVY
jgi:hypothetical protein